MPQNEIALGLVVLLGLATVFVGLFMLFFAVKIMSAIFLTANKKGGKKDELASVRESEVEVAEPKQAVAVNSEIPHGDMVAAVSAAVAELMGTDVSGLRILSIKRTDAVFSEGTAANMDISARNAAIACAIASAIDTDVQGLRIHSIKQVSGQ